MSNISFSAPSAGPNKKLVPTQEMVDVAECLMAAMALRDTVKPIVRKYETAILASREWQVASKFEARLGERIITDPEKVYLLSPEDMAEYEALRQKACKESGLYVKEPEFCPFCVARHKVIQYEAKMLDSMAHVTGFSYADISVHMDLREKTVTLTKSLLFSRCREARVLELADGMSVGTFPLLN